MSQKNNLQQIFKSRWVEVFKTIGLSLVFSFGIRTFVAQGYYVASGSMEPTLQVNDRLMVDKLSYQFKPPQRGDIVVFSPTKRLQQENFQDHFIKRVIGLPGERVEVTGGRVYINNRPLEEHYVSEAAKYRWGPVTVPPNSYLVLGDNRNNSYDGHYWGFVHRDYIIGQAVVRFWPFNRLGDVDRDSTHD